MIPSKGGKSSLSKAPTPRSKTPRKKGNTFHQEGKGNLDQEYPKDAKEIKDTSDDRVKKTKKDEKKSSAKPRNKDKEKEKEQQERIQKWCEKVMAVRVFDINKEFIANKTYKPAAFTTEAYNKNDQKNRYGDILCMDANRVVLKDRQPEEDYMHANWVTTPDGQKYICAQAPVTATLEDFWHMIYTEKSNVIVMLTALEDDETVAKCTRYFPTELAQPFTAGIYKITKDKESEEPFPGIRQTVLQVEKEGSTPMTVYHFVYDTWTDHTAPQTATVAVRLFWRCRKLAEMAPITVHCSAGIGRSATFIGIDYARQKIMAEGDKCNMVDVLREMRGMRLHAIQSAVQYLFLHLCLLELFAGEGLLTNNTKYERWIKNYQTLLARCIEMNKNRAEKKNPSKEAL